MNNVEVIVQLKYLVNFLITLELQLINIDAKLMLIRAQNWIKANSR